MRTLGTVFLVCAAASIAAHATDREFKDVVNAIADEFHARPTHIPFFGLVNVVTFMARPAGTKHIDLALFENLNSYDREGRDVMLSVRRAVGGAWKPFVQVWSRKPGHDETVMVYVRMQGRDCTFLVANVEPNEATVVQVKLNPEALQKWLVLPRESVMHRWGRERDQ